MKKNITLEELCNEISISLYLESNEINGESNLFEYGMDSMDIIFWVNKFKEYKCYVSLKELYDNPKPSSWFKLLKQKTVSKQEDLPKVINLPVMKEGHPFELTSVQHAYFIGRSSHQTLGGVGCHLYQEFDGSGLCPKVLEKSIYTLINRHNMLKVKFNGDGLQEYQEKSFWNGLVVHDFQKSSDYEKQLLRIRKQLDHRLLNVEKGETFDIQLSLLPDGKHRVHVNIDLLILDAVSFSLFFQELSLLILGKELEPIDPNYDFCSYLSHLNQQNANERESSKLYWQEKCKTLPIAPVLPLDKKPEQIKKVSISRRSEEINKQDWEKLEKASASIGVTPTMVLATCLGAVLSRWGSQERLLLNLTLFDRLPLHKSVDKIMADFTNILLIDLLCKGQTIDKMAKENQNTFIEAYENRHWTGVEVLRQLRKSGTHLQGAPVIFTCSLGDSLYGENVIETFGEPVWGISQTPQAWIDHFAFKQGSSTHLRWDSNDELFPDELVEVMFNAYISIVREIINNPDALHQEFPDLMPKSQIKQRQIVNKTDSYIPEGLLHYGFLENAKNNPNSIALIYDSMSITYSELNDMVQKCAQMLKNTGVNSGDRVAISMSKGIGQVVSSLAILQIGAVYVPVALEQPIERRKTICKNANVKAILICKNDIVAEKDSYDKSMFNVIEWQEYINFSSLQYITPVSAQQPAYIIYTSGSTGTPKGVVISHKGALNTCYDINKRYNINSNDRILALSEFHFDLSVYDIFGVLSAGGSIVIVNQISRRDPSHWCELIEQHNVTIWNTVPALFDMLLTYSEGMNLNSPAFINTVMLSGDFIGLDLFPRYRNFQKNGKFIAMGGATEASIWSNALEVENIPNEWSSIPYGYPLANQQYRVVDSFGRDCPDWVAGELWIGGEGVALGYFNDTEKTSAQFLEKDNSRWYRTGDMGRYWNNGILEFLGRKDKQVKIGGYRIELGEIDTAINKIDGVKMSASLAVGEKEKKLIAFATVEKDSFNSAVYGDKSLPSDYNVLIEKNDNTINNDVTKLECKEYEEILSNITADFLFKHLQQQGIDFTSSINLQQVMDCYGAESIWTKIFNRWLQLLVKQEYIISEKDTNSYIINNNNCQKDIILPKNSHLLALSESLLNYHKSIEQIIKGQRRVETLLNHPVLAPESFLSELDGVKNCINTLVDIIKILSKSLQRPVNIVEIGCRSGIVAEKILQKLDADCAEYIALDESQEMVLRTNNRLDGFVNANAHRQEKAFINTIKHQADIVFSNNFLHTKDISAIKYLYDLAKPSGLIYALEKSVASDIGLVITDLFSPDGDGAGSALRSSQEWHKHLSEYNLEYQFIDQVLGVDRFVFRAPNEILIENPQEIVSKLSNYLPNYMIPKNINIIEEFPLTVNGKIDYKLLTNFYEEESVGNKEYMENVFENEIEKSLAKILCELLGVKSINRKSDFFEIGGDSLLATRLIGKLDEIGYSAELADLFNYPVFENFSATIVPKTDGESRTLTLDETNRYEPFELSDIQRAYLSGRKKGFLLSGVGSQFFVEFDVGELDITRFENAVNYLVNRHDMLKTVVEGENQRVLKETPKFILKTHSFNDFDDIEAKELRDKLSKQVIDPTSWPVFDIQAMKNKDEKYRIFICLDNLMLDGLSMRIFFIELEQKYLFPEIDFPKIGITFRDYLVSENNREPSKNSIDYWNQRLKSLPSAPKLPFVKELSKIEQPKFIRFFDKLEENEWSALKNVARKEGITTSALLLSVYSSVLSSWSKNDSLSINLILFDRKYLHPHIEQVLGDFTSLLLVSWEPENKWRESVQKLQKRLQKDIVHSDVSPMYIMRKLALERGHNEALMPIVFTSALGNGDKKFLSKNSWLKQNWGISQTPQVCLDNQVFETDGELHFNWDVLEELFNFDEISTIFKQYKNMLLQIANNEDVWDKTINELTPKNVDSENIQIESPKINKKLEVFDTLDNQILENICEQFETVVKSKINPDENFFEAGASSLQLIEIHASLQKSLYKELTITDFFTYPNPSVLSEYLSSINKIDEVSNNNSISKQKELLNRRKSRASKRR